MRYEQHLATPEVTAALGRRLGGHLLPGTVIALIGPLGAGKTTLTRAIAESLGVDAPLVASPTFALVHEYPGRWPVYHFDVYRLSDLKSFLDLGVEEYFNGGGVCLIEWADRVASALPADHLRITLSHDGNSRRVVIESTGVSSDEIVNAVSQSTGQDHAK